MKRISPSMLALQASGLPPISEYLLEHDALCVMCGIEMKAGDRATKWKPKATFTNYRDLAQPQSTQQCEHCAGADRSEFKQTWATGAVLNSEGVHKANTINTLAYLFLNPPKTPFLMIRSDQMQQHMVWRTPVTYDANLYRIRLGEKVFTIRRELLLQARDYISTAGKLIQHIPKELHPKVRANPGNELGFYRYLDWNVSSTEHGLLSEWLQTLEDNADKFNIAPFVELRNLLNSLNFGEVWALMLILKCKTPVKPPIVANPL